MVIAASFVLQLRRRRRAGRVVFAQAGVGGEVRRPVHQVRFRRYRFSPTGDFGYRGKGAR
jgi:hypothetical protein